MVPLNHLQFLLLCIITSSFYMFCNGMTVYNVHPGRYGTKRESSGLYLSATSSFQPIESLSTVIHVTAPAAIFVHYQVTIDVSGCDFWTKLQVNSFTAGSLVHIGSQQQYKTATGYWAANINPGYYTFEVHYKSSHTISMSASTDYQTAVINLIWYDGMRAASDGIKCHTNPNTYNALSPIKDTEVFIQHSGEVLAAYQVSVYSSNGRLMTRMNMNDQQLYSTTMANGNGYYLNFHGMWMKFVYGECYFGLTYRNAYSSTQFEDCQNSYKDNTNLFAITIPDSRCFVRRVEPTTSLSLSTTSWRDTDLSYKRTLNYDHHVIVRYQFSGTGRNTYTITRLTINNVLQPHTASIRSNMYYSGNSGFWQGLLPAGSYTFTVQHRSGSTYTHYIANYRGSYEEYTRAMDILFCY